MKAPETITVTKVCPLCGKDNQVTVMKDHYNRWLQGEYAQVAFPEMTPDDREALISGTHSTCWDELFPEEEG